MHIHECYYYHIHLYFYFILYIQINIIQNVFWWSRIHGLNSKSQTNRIFQILNDRRWCDDGLGQVLTALFIISEENKQQRSRAACRSFPRSWQGGLRDISFYPLLQLLWQRWMAWWKKSVMRMSQPRATLPLCVCADQGLMIHGHNHSSFQRMMLIVDISWKSLGLFGD